MNLELYAIDGETSLDELSTLRSLIELNDFNDKEIKSVKSLKVGETVNLYCFPLTRIQ